MDPSTQSALARSRAYGFFARALLPPGNSAWLPELAESPENLAAWLAASGIPGRAPNLGDLRNGFLVGESRGTLREECARLFHNRGGEGCPSCETEYLNAHVFQRAQQMADIAGFYAAFGLETSAEGERVDHVAMELEFMHFLCCKEAHAAQNHPERVELCRDAQAKFLADHLGRWTGVFAQMVARAASEPFFTHLTRLLDAFVAADAERLGARPERVLVPPARPRKEEEEARACGSAGDFVEIAQLTGAGGSAAGEKRGEP